METFSTLLAICAGNSPVTSEFSSQRPVTWSFDVFFDLRLNKRLSKQSWDWWFEMPLHSLWCHCIEMPYDVTVTWPKWYLLWCAQTIQSLAVKILSQIHYLSHLTSQVNADWHGTKSWHLARQWATEISQTIYNIMIHILLQIWFAVKWLTVIQSAHNFAYAWQLLGQHRFR